MARDMVDAGSRCFEELELADWRREFAVVLKSSRLLRFNARNDV